MMNPEKEKKCISTFNEFWEDACGISPKLRKKYSMKSMCIEAFDAGYLAAQQWTEIKSDEDLPELPKIKD